MSLLFFAAGLVLFLWSMRQLEISIGRLGSHSLKQLIKDYTRTPLQGVLVGVTATAILQSSSFVGLITLAFVGAGIMPLRNAIGIILGSNLGTTLTGWIVTLLGFKLNIAEFYILMLGVAALGLLVAPSKKRMTRWFRVLFSFSLLLMGLFLMKDSIDFLHEYVDTELLKTLHPVLFFLLGMGLTAVTQSSSATMMIALSAIHQGIITLPNAAALIIGADLGTTSTVILGSLQGSITKRQVALVHFLFNLIVDLSALMALPLLLLFIRDGLQISDPLFALVAIHSTFNFFGILAFLPFVNWLERTVKRIFPTPKESELSTKQVSYQVVSLALTAAEKDLKHLLLTVVALNTRRFKLSPPIPKKSTNGSDMRPLFMRSSVDVTYQSIKEIESKLADYLLDIQKQDLSTEQLQLTLRFQVCLRDTLYAAKSLKDANDDLEMLAEFDDFSAAPSLQQLKQETQIFYQRLVDWLSQDDSDGNHNPSEPFLAQIKHTHDRFNATIYELIDNQQLPHEAASMTLNVNREVLLSSRSLLNAALHLKQSVNEPSSITSLLK